MQGRIPVPAKQKAVLPVTFLARLLGHGAPRHTTDDISSVSISCGHMCRSCGYSFWVHAEGSTLLFDADCFIHQQEIPAVLASIAISGGEFETLLDLIRADQLIQYAEQYKQPPRSPIVILDDTTYGFCLTFKDGTSLLTRDRQEKLETYFYALAEKYATTQDPAGDHLSADQTRRNHNG